MAALILAADACFFPQELVFNAPLFALAAFAFPVWLSRYGDYHELPGLAGFIARRPILRGISILSCIIVASVNFVFLLASYTAPRLPIFVATVYFVAWPSCVSNACIRGYATKVAAWPCIPLYTLHRSVNLKFLLSWKNWIWIGASVLSFPIMWILIDLLADLWDDSKGIRVPLTALGSGSIALVVFRALVGLGRLLRRRRHDAVLIREVTRRGSEIDASTLLNALSRVRTPQGARSVLEHACGADLSRYPATLQVLSDLGAVIESKDQNSVALGHEVKEWRQTASAQTRKAVNEAGSATLDRMARAVERAEIARQGEPGSL